VFLDLVPSPVTGTFWVSDIAGTPITEIFQVTDLSDHPIYVAGVLVQATTFVGSLPSVPTIGSGLVNRNPLRVNFTATIPNGQGFRIYYGIGYPLATIPENSWVRKDIPNSGNGAGFEFVDSSTFTDPSLGTVDSLSGGVGVVPSQQPAFENIDSRLTKLRAFVATVSDNSTSLGGDHNNADIRVIIDGAVNSLGGGIYPIKAGIYSIPATAVQWNIHTHFLSASANAATIKLAAGYAGLFPVTGAFPVEKGVILERVGLGSLSTTGIYNVTGNFEMRGPSTLEAGCLKLNPGGTSRQVIEGVNAVANGSLTSATGALEITGSGIVRITECEFTPFNIPSSSSPVALLNIHNFNGFLVVEDCVFVSATPDLTALRMLSVTGLCHIKNCEFISAAATGAGWGLDALDCADIVFENCVFVGETGQAIRAINSGITFKECIAASGSSTPLANPQLICGEGIVSGTDQTHKLRFINCTAQFGAANVRASGAPSLPIIELGGHGENFSGTTATTTAFAANKVTLGNLSGMTPDVVGSSITITGSAANNGTFPVTDYVSATSIKYLNAGGSSPDANSGAIHWNLVNVPTAFSGQVEVDGLVVSAENNTIGVHNNTTVVLHDHPSNRAPNRYARITIDVKGNNPLNTGTLGSYGAKSNKVFNGLAQGCVIEIVGAEPAGVFDSNRPKLVVENLQLLHIGSPATIDVPRSVIQAAWCTIQGLVIDGSGPSAFSYTNPVSLNCRSVEISDLQMFPTAGVPVNSGSSSEMISLLGGCRLTGLRYHHRGIMNWGAPGATLPLFNLNSDSVLKNAFVYIDIDIKLTNHLILVSDRSKIEGSTFITRKLNGTTQSFVKDNGGESNVIVNNLFQWTNVVGNRQAANITGNFSVVMGNQFLTESGAAGDVPTTVVSGANVIDINILGYGATTPIVVEVY
jgi:hypothetical protein